MTFKPIKTLWPLMVLLLSCVSTPDFDNASIVDRPRVLAVIAEPPEAAPGQDVALSLLLAGFPEPPTRIVWLACGAFTSTMGGRQYGDEADRKGCGGTSLSLPLGEGERVVIDGDISQLFFDNANLAAETFGSVLPPGTVDVIKTQVGIAMLVEARVEYGAGKVFRATKRVVFREGQGHTNPPGPSFYVGEIPIVPATDEPFRCRTADGSPLSLAPRERVELSPLREASDTEAWLEDYFVLNARGELIARTEQAFYSWYADAGSFDESITKSPLRNNIYRAPREPGCYHLWLVVQDGHGGGSACQLDFGVPPEICE